MNNEHCILQLSAELWQILAHLIAILVFLQHAVMDILMAFEPGHATVMEVMGFLVEDSKRVDFPDDFTRIYIAIGGLADRLITKRR